MVFPKIYLYVGHYVDSDGNYILKIGVTNNLQRRAAQHNYYYRRTKKYTLPKNGKFEYDWSIKVSVRNGTFYESENREQLQKMGIGQFVKNDRFCCQVKPVSIPIKIKKIYNVCL